MVVGCVRMGRLGFWKGKNMQDLINQLQEINYMINPDRDFLNFDDWENSIIKANHKLTILIKELKNE